MNNQNKFDTFEKVISRFTKDTTSGKTSKLTSQNLFDAWVLLDYTRFSLGRLRDFELSGIGITPEQSALLQILARRNGKSTIGEISDRWMRRQHSVSTLIHRMEKLDLVKIHKYPKRKELEVVITDKGLDLYNQITRSSIEAVYSVLSDEEIQRLSLYLTLLQDRAREILSAVDQ
jgi:DNA-binding MarR family transcriptional regulator